jgi:HlyD family secretion protein
MPFRSRTAPALALAVLAASAVAGCADKKADAAPVQTVPAQRQTIVVDVEATGVITPINAVEVRSKASGQITQLRVTTGTPVKEGDLLARIDPRDPQSRFDQARAAVNAAQINVQVARAQFERNQALSQQGVITAPEFETTRTAYAQAQSQLTSARTQLDLARIALEDVTIRAPSNGTVIARNVSQGQVITSSTNSPSGGTILLRIANLGTVYDSTLVNESDIGKVKPGQPATVTVDAYPGRTFRGIVEKIEPQAVVQQSVTMFPVLVSLNNELGLLKPGMNGEVSVLIERKENVLTVSNDAIRTLREAATSAAALGLDPDTVQAQIRAQFASMGGGMGGGMGCDGMETMFPAPEVDQNRATLSMFPRMQVDNIVLFLKTLSDGYFTR